MRGEHYSKQPQHGATKVDEFLAETLVCNRWSKTSITRLVVLVVSKFHCQSGSPSLSLVAAPLNDRER